jgi:hypothetical protein
MWEKYKINVLNAREGGEKLRNEDLRRKNKNFL